MILGCILWKHMYVILPSLIMVIFASLTKYYKISLLLECLLPISGPLFSCGYIRYKTTCTAYWIPKLNVYVKHVHQGTYISSLSGWSKVPFKHVLVFFFFFFFFLIRKLFYFCNFRCWQQICFFANWNSSRNCSVDLIWSWSCVKVSKLKQGIIAFMLHVLLGPLCSKPDKFRHQRAVGLPSYPKIHLVLLLCWYLLYINVQVCGKNWQCWRISEWIFKQS